MTQGDEFFAITMRRRSWWFWALTEFWLLLEIVILQTAWASVRESEYRAATICWIAAAVMAALGVYAWMRLGLPRRKSASNSRPRDSDALVRDQPISQPWRERLSPLRMTYTPGWSWIGHENSQAPHPTQRLRSTCGCFCIRVWPSPSVTIAS